MGKQLQQFKRIRPEQWEEGKPIIGLSHEDVLWMTLMVFYESQMGEGYAGSMVKERLELSGNKKLWAQWRCAEGMIGKVMTALYDTLPYKNMKHLCDMVDNGEVHIRLRPPQHGKGLTLVDNNDLDVLCDAALRADDCRFCVKEGRELKQCQLRKVLEVVLPPSGERPKIDSCVYRHVDFEL